MEMQIRLNKRLFDFYLTATRIKILYAYINKYEIYHILNIIRLMTGIYLD